jgi:hypothetical protein
MNRVNRRLENHHELVKLARLLGELTERDQPVG